MSAIKTTDLVASLGAYARDHNFSDIISKAFVNEDFMRLFDVQDGITDERPMPKLTVGKLSKPYTDGSFNPNADTLDFGARILKVRQAKADLLLKPADLYHTWLGLAKTPGFDPNELPFEAFIMEQIALQIRDEIHLDIVYNGVYNVAGTTPGEVANGFLKLIADEITALNVTPIATGAITVTNAVDSFEAMYDALGDAYKKREVVFRCSDTIANLYKRNYRNTFGGNTDFDEFNRLKIDGTSAIIEKDFGMSGSGRVILTQKNNFTLGTDLESDFNDFDIEKFERSIKIMTEYSVGVQFKEVHADALVVNDQA